MLSDTTESLFESLPQLTKLESYSVGVDFLKKLFEIAPQISSLTTIVDTPALHFICENFKNLSFLDLLFTADDQEESDALARIDQLARLKELVLISCPVRNVVFPHSNVRCLTLKTCKKLTDEDLLKLPERFPMLKRLTIKYCNLVSVAGINLLHKSIPTCRIDLNGQRFYPLA
ncbi:uncharacterized protein LOC128278983 [Anopheles cruzii]|uniref:uncharacterized protein LOC128278983 n=1 Tax=Anopheles cruzii TaxID=68878 RepID=UPI0022EC985E|nr:uncharacterized protein LOC128278983 [Anopheles cruzii]